MHAWVWLHGRAHEEEKLVMRVETCFRGQIKNKTHFPIIFFSSSSSFPVTLLPARFFHSKEGPCSFLCQSVYIQYEKGRKEQSPRAHLLRLRKTEGVSFGCVLSVPPADRKVTACSWWQLYSRVTPGLIAMHTHTHTPEQREPLPLRGSVLLRYF